MMTKKRFRFSRLGRVFRAPGLMAQGPWGGNNGSGSGDEGDAGGGGSAGGGADGPRNPWTQPNAGGPRRPGGGQSRSSLVEDLLKRGRQGFGGGGGNGGPGGGFPVGEARSFWPIALAIIVILWLALTSFHRIGPQERGVVLVLGQYSRTLTPGIGLTLPAPLETVEVVDVEEIRVIDIGSVAGNNENLVLTGDQNIIDLAYSVRWNIRDAELYKFQIADPDETIREVAESAMRSVVATVMLTDALGAGRTEIEQRVEQRMQQILDGYRSGVRVQGIAIKQADPPAAVNDAFKEVSAAKQDATTYVNQARAYAQQLTARAQGEAAAFDKVYEEYRLAPDVTRRRMYYETMESVLSDIDKTIVESGNVTPYLPLPEIRRRAAQAPAQSGAATEGGR